MWLLAEFVDSNFMLFLGMGYFGQWVIFEVVGTPVPEFSCV